MIRVSAPAVLIIMLFSLLPLQANAGHSCSISPFSQKIKVGEEAFFEANLKGGDDPYSLELGNLPENITGGFQNNSDNKVDLFVKTTSAVIPQSVSIVVLYSIQNEETAVCQLNLVIQPINSRGLTRSKGKTSTSAPLVKKINNGLPASFNSLVNPSTEKFKTAFTKNLKFGQWDHQVTSLQDFLRAGGYFPHYQGSTGYFGPITLGSLKNFQTKSGLQPTGMLDEPTRLKIKTGS